MARQGAENGQKTIAKKQTETNKTPTQTSNRKETILTETDAVSDQKGQEHNKGQRDQDSCCRSCLQGRASEVARAHPYLEALCKV